MCRQAPPPLAPRVTRPAVQPEIAILLLSLLFLGGCSGPVLKRVPVDGLVSIDGVPLQSGTIRFIPTGNTKGPAAVATIEDGLYELSPDSGPIIGQHRIEIEATNHLGFELDDEQAHAKKAEQGQPIPANPIPVTFNRQSNLLIDVPEEGRAGLDFRLTSAGVLADSR